ncbi:MAG TPA: hypothetical protein ENI33_06655 [Thermoplasmatales archaeon]|nr:hypothetical protein [Thermoplasmatales archaeon]
MKKAIIVIALLLPIASASPVHEWNENVVFRNIKMYAPAVASGEDGYYGVLTEVNVTMMNGSGNVFVVTSPLTQLDMQGSAKLAVDVAGMLTGKDVSKYDFFFQVKAESPIVGGPSAGGVMTIASICLLQNIDARDDIVMTGMINPDGSIGPVGGILEKGEAAGEAGMKYFLIPKGQGIEYKFVEERIGPLVFYNRVAVNVSEELYKKYGIIVKEVEDINEALYYFTNYTFYEEKSDKPILTFEYYKEIMQPLAEKILEEANESYKKADEMFKNSNIPFGYPLNNPYGYVSNALNNAKYAFQEAETAYKNLFYYYSISKAFQSKIDSLFVIYACRYYNGTGIEEIYGNVSNAVENALQKSENEEIKGLVSLQCVGAAQQRALDALAYLNKTGYNKLNTLYYLAYSMERSRTVYWWLNLSDKFNESYEVNDTWVGAMVEKYYEYAQNIVSYAEILSEETGYSKQFVNKANELLQLSNEQKQKYPSASLFNSLEAIANANLAIETIGLKEDDIGYKLNRTSQMASYAIQKARNMSIEPILAVSYAEFGRSLEMNEVIKSLTYYKYAYMIANMLSLSSGYEIKQIYKTNEQFSQHEKNEEKVSLIEPISIGIIAFIVGISAGIIIGKGKNGRNKGNNTANEYDDREDEINFEEEKFDF